MVLEVKVEVKRSFKKTISHAVWGYKATKDCLKIIFLLNGALGTSKSLSLKVSFFPAVFRREVRKALVNSEQGELSFMWDGGGMTLRADLEMRQFRYFNLKFPRPVNRTSPPHCQLFWEYILARNPVFRSSNVNFSRTFCLWEASSVDTKKSLF